jgi:predicted nucleic acid-binding protein
MHMHETRDAVLDTNVVLDWLFFEDVGVDGLARALMGRRMRWIACESMRCELAQVLERPPFSSRQGQAAHVLATFDHLAVLLPAPASLSSLRCSDPDDQPFVDLALAHRATWLFSRDRALLDLARPAARAGVTILPPIGWQDG